MFCLLLVLVELAVILRLNQGKFVYTLDDAYIHLSLAENLRHGHYGINHEDFSAPSSSILWPFLLAPFGEETYFEYVPFFFNILFAVLNIGLFGAILSKSIPRSSPAREGTLTFLLLLLILATNQIGLIFTGMEHSLQVFCALLILYGLIVHLESRQITLWLVTGTLLAPLVRYENLALVIAVFLYLASQREYRWLSTLSVGVLLPLAAFSWFLWRNSAGLLPSSVQAKSAVVSSAGALSSVLRNFWENLNSLSGIGLSLAVLVFMGIFFHQRRATTYHQGEGGVSARAKLAMVLAVAILLHFAFGRYGWYNRYEIYIWSVALVGVLYFFGGWLVRDDPGTGRRRPLIRLVGVALGVFGFCPSYLWGLRTIPLASNNIYEQHYQMHRFVTLYYPRAVAVNDIGYVSFRNENYVLDLYGLGSSEARRFRSQNQGSEWMNALAAAHGVTLAMIYEQWYILPANWRKIGELYLGRPRITPEFAKVDFYLLKEDVYNEVLAALQQFEATLPPGVRFEYTYEP